jgi:hypothetical protein
LSAIGPIKLRATVKASVLIMAYNVERFVEQALDSVLMQRVAFDYKIVMAKTARRTGRAPSFVGMHPNIRRKYALFSAKKILA